MGITSIAFLREKIPIGLEHFRYHFTLWKVFGIRIRMPAWMPEWLDINFMVPLIATVIVVAVGILVICVALSRRRSDDFNGGQKDVYCRFYYYFLYI